MIYKVIEIRFTAEGQIYANSHDGWTVINYPDEPLQIKIFSRDDYRIKIVVYQHPIEYLDTFGVWLCRALLGDEGYVWKHVDLSECDR